MHPVRLTKLLSSACFFVALITGVWSTHAMAQSPAAKVIGTVKSVSGSSVVVTLDNGTETSVSFADTARILRAVPGQDVKSVAPVPVSDIQVGDRLSARGQAGDANSLTASVALVMKKSDIAQKQQQEREEWRKGVGGLVKEINASAGTITIPNSLAGAGKQTVIHVSPQTDVRRYSPDSVKFEDAKPSSLDQIRAGDQVRARGTKSEDGSEFTAQAIVSGAFREMAATVVSNDAANNRVTVTDLATKKPLTIKVAPDSMPRKLPQFLAMGIAICLKGGSLPAIGGAAPGQRTSSTSGSTVGSQSGAVQRDGQRGLGNSGGKLPGNGQGGSGGFGGFGGSGGHPPDCQQLLARMPEILARIPPMTLADLNKGDAVMLVATEGSEGSGPTAITLLAGVEPILTAAPPGMNAAATVLSPWNLGQGGAGGGGGEGGPGQ